MIQSETQAKIEAATGDELQGMVRAAGWQPRQMREQVDDFPFPAHIRAAILREADEIEARGPLAAAELKRRVSRYAFTGYVS